MNNKNIKLQSSTGNKNKYPLKPPQKFPAENNTIKLSPFQKFSFFSQENLTLLN